MLYLIKNKSFSALLVALLLIPFLWTCEDAANNIVLPPKSNEKEMSNVRITVGGQTVATQMQADGRTFLYMTPLGIDEDALKEAIVVFTISRGAIAVPASGISRDLTGNVMYKVSAQDGSVADYFLNRVFGTSAEADFLDFSLEIAGNVFIGDIDDEALEVNFAVPFLFEDDLETAVPVFELSLGATTPAVSGEEVDFSNLAVTYLITAHDQVTTKTWTAKVTIEYPPIPEQVINPTVQNVAGGAIITYTIPDDEEWKGVKALYSYQQGGEILEVTSNTNSIEILGFPDELERTVQLVSFSEFMQSDPVTVTIKPTTPDYILVSDLLTVSEAYDGVLLQWENPNNAELVISLIAEDASGDMNLVQSLTVSASGSRIIRGLAIEEAKFRVEVADSWNNMEVAFEDLLTPIFEEDVVPRGADERATWIRYGYGSGPPNDCEWRGDYRDVRVAANNRVYHLWEMFTPVRNGNEYFIPGEAPSFRLNHYTGNSEHEDLTGDPLSVTIDMTRETKLSRLKVFFSQRSLATGFTRAYEPFHISIYATNETPKGPSDFGNDKIASLAYWTPWTQVSGTDAWKDDWTHIAELEFIPPSGSITLSNWTAEDELIHTNGWDFEIFPQHIFTPYRYLRLVVHSTHGPNIDQPEHKHYVWFCYWQFFGAVVQ